MTPTKTAPETATAPALLKRKDAAAWLGITTSALAQLAYRGTGPKYVIIGTRTVRYRMSDLVEYVESNIHTQSGSAA